MKINKKKCSFFVTNKQNCIIIYISSQSPSLFSSWSSYGHLPCSSFDHHCFRKGVKREDSGLYSCSASNTVGERAHHHCIHHHYHHCNRYYHNNDYHYFGLDGILISLFMIITIIIIFAIIVNFSNYQSICIIAIPMTMTSQIVDIEGKVLYIWSGDADSSPLSLQVKCEPFKPCSFPDDCENSVKNIQIKMMMILFYFS